MPTFQAQQRPDPPTIDELQSLLAAERAARIRLQEELQLRNCAVDAATTHFMIIDVSTSAWRIVYVNRAICEHHGYSVAELLDRNPRMLICPTQSREALHRWTRPFVRAHPWVWSLWRFARTIRPFSLG